MTTPSALTRLNEGFAGFWTARSDRERKQLILALLVAALGLSYILLIEPAYVGRAKLAKSLPALRLQAAELRSLSASAKSLAGVNAPPPPDMTQEAITAAITRNGVTPQTVAVTGNLAKIQLSSASFAGMVTWLDDMQKTMRVTVVDANVTALAQPDTVNATLTLRQQKNE